MPKTLTWLHISDIHLHPRTEWRDSASRASLLKYLKELIYRDEQLRPDLIFCTGDIAFGETSVVPLSDQYEQAKVFFDELLAVCGKENVPLSKERLFIVPGNHDVNRNRVNADAQKTLTRWAGEAKDHVCNINQRFNDKTPEFKDAISRLDEYAAFVKSYLPHQHDADHRHHYSKIVDIDNLKICIVGFNSAWSCAGSEDDRNIWLAAEWQFNRARCQISESNLCIGLIHHPIDWLNTADRDIANRRVASDLDFLLHGHSHSAWVTPIQTHIVIAAGAVGTEQTDEFGINISSINIESGKGVVHLHNKRAGSNGWTIAPVHPQASNGQWDFDLPMNLIKRNSRLLPDCSKFDDRKPTLTGVTTNNEFIDRIFSKKLASALQTFSSQPNVWVNPTLNTQAEIAQDAQAQPRIELADFLKNPSSTIIKAPPQYGLTCLAHYLVLEAWRSPEHPLWIYLDSKELKPNTASINKAVAEELAILGRTDEDIKCVILDSWVEQDKDAVKLLKALCERFRNTRIICMQQTDGDLFNQIDKSTFPHQFETLYLWSLSRSQVRKIVSAYNEEKNIGDEDSVTNRIVADLEVLNLHRTPLNCLTLLKVSEIDFDESPVNRSEMIKRVLFLLFNFDNVPTYKSRPDLKDCEYVLGYFCEILIREESYQFSRDRFLLEIQKCCHERLIDLETHIVFDVLFANNILVKRGSFFSFKFSYWIFYFAAQRMLHSEEFAAYIFEDMRYAKYPEIIEFYTGIDRRREDAIETLIRDISACCNSVKLKCGLPVGLNPYRFGKWIPSPEAGKQMEEEIANGVRESNLPAAVKDQYADRHYDRSRPYDQSIKEILAEHSVLCMLQTMKAGAKALRNSDYVSPSIKRQLLKEILHCWEQASMVLLVVLPILAKDGFALYDGTGFILVGDFGSTPQERALRILNEIPNNVISWCEHDLFSKKMGPLLFDQLNDKEISDGGFNLEVQHDATTA